MAWQISMHVWRMGPLRASQAALLNHACQILYYAQGLSRMLPAVGPGLKCSGKASAGYLAQSPH